MKKVVSILLVLSLICLGIAGCTPAPSASTPAEPSEEASTPAEPAKTIKIAYFVSDMRETFHQAQAAEAQKYAKEEYGAEVIIFDGKGDSSVMTANIDQIVAQGMDAATLHIWDNDAAKPGIQAALDNGVAMASFFSPVPGTGIPVVRNDEAGISKAMGKEMAEQWKAANPDKPIVMLQLGWPNNTDVITGRTDPFVEGVKSVDPNAVDLGCIDASAGEDTAKQIIKDMCTQHPEVNLIYAESGGIARGVMAGLNEAGRGTVAADGKPTTELVCACDYDEAQLKEIFDTDSSLKLSLALPPIETGATRIDVLMDLINKKITQVDTTEKEYLAKAYLMSYYSTTRADNIAWLNKQFGMNLQ